VIEHGTILARAMSSGAGLRPTGMDQPAERYRKVAAAFTERARAVPAGRWDDPAPCEGWVARDVVRHLVEWVPAFFVGTWGIEAPALPSVDDDPVGAWLALDRTLQAALDDPEVARSERDTHIGRSSFEATLDMTCTGDVFIHTWDLARATGLDERLASDEVHRMLEGMEPMDEILRSSGQFGPRVEVAADADEQSRLLAFLGRQPG
jgi:uncharacterized protein (TIGR03086 family)